MATLTQLTIFLASFLIVALASPRIGQFFARFLLPLISGFLFAGILADPYVLGLISRDLTESLRFAGEVSLAVIAFAARSELYLKELHSRMKSIAWATIGHVLVIPTTVAITVLVLADAIPFMQELPAGAQLGVVLMTGAIPVARAPSSAIAIVNELRASGPFTETVPGVTMLTDAAVVVLFAISSSIHIQPLPPIFPPRHSADSPPTTRTLSLRYCPTTKTLGSASRPTSNSARKR